MRIQPAVKVRKEAIPDGGPVRVPVRPVPDLNLSRSTVIVLVVLGVAMGLGIYQSLDRAPEGTATTQPREVALYEVGRERFESRLRAGGTVGAVNFVMIRVPSMRGGRDRGGGSLTIESMAMPGTMVRKGDIVASLESRRTADIMDDYESNLAQTKRRTASRKADLMISSETLRQNLLEAQASAEKAALDLRTAEVKSQIQAEILALQTDQHRATAKQLAQEVRLTEIADTAYARSLEIDVEKAQRRLDRTASDFEKLNLRSPVDGLVVIESMFRRDSTSQTSAGDQVNPGSMFMRIVDLSRMAIFASVNQADAQLVEIGTPAEVRLDAYPGAVFQGRVSSIGAVAAAVGSSGGGRGPRGGSRSSGGKWVKQVAVEIEILAEDERIKPDLSASADILIAAADDAVVVPRASVGTSAEGDVVWVQQGESFDQRRVEIGMRSDTQATVLSGLSAGEVIAAQPIADPAIAVAALQ